jgi:hypothetical protein
MAVQTYATDVLGKIDERFYLDSVTKDVVNNDTMFEFNNGNNAVTIYQVNVTSENDYVRNGVMRYGQLVEVGTATQTVLLSQDKSFAISVDRGNSADSKNVLDIDEAVKRQVREVSVPTTDIYILNIAATYAVANSQSATAALSASNMVTKLLDQRAQLIESKVMRPTAKNPVPFVVYVSPTAEAYLWLDPLFKAACDKRTADVASGQIGTFMGMDIRVVPSTYFIANFGFMMLAKNVLIAPMKFNKIKTMDGDYFGIDGDVGFGRRYYDCFIRANRGVGIRLHKVA